MFSRDNNSYKAKSRYNEIHIGKKIIEIVDLLVENNLIHEKKLFLTSFDESFLQHNLLFKKFFLQVRKLGFHNIKIS